MNEALLHNIYQRFITFYVNSLPLITIHLSILLVHLLVCLYVCGCVRCFNKYVFIFINNNL